MTNQTPESVIAEVLDEERYYDRSQISNDSRATEIVEALRAANMLREPGGPDAATAAIERVTAERDAAMARIAKAWELHEPFTWSFGYGPVQSCKWCADHGVSQEVASWPCPTIQALEGAPEPEGKPSSTVDEAAPIREAKAEALEEKGYFLKGHAEWTRSNFLPGPNSDACAKYNDEIGDELIEDAAELRARAAEYREGSET